MPQALLKLSYKREVFVIESMAAKDISSLLYSCRWLSVFFDLHFQLSNGNAYPAGMIVMIRCRYLLFNGFSNVRNR